MNNVFYKILAVILLMLVIIIPFFRIDGGLVDDDYYYIKIAESIPRLNLTVFPIGYPLLLKAVNLFLNDYFLSFRFIAVTSFIFVLFFSYYKNFFFKETVLLLGLKFYTLFFYSLSETVFLPIFYIVIYALYQIIINKKRKYFLLGFCLFLLVTIRYSGLFVWGGIFTFVVLEYFFTKEKENTIILKDMIRALTISILLIIVFLGFNYYYTYALFGENVREDSLLYNSNPLNFLMRSILFPIIVAFNPVSEIFRFSKTDFFITTITSILFCVIFIYLFYKSLKFQHTKFLKLTIIISIMYFLGLLYSSYTTGIEALHFRLSSPFLMMIYFTVLIALKNKFYNNLFVTIVLISFCFNIYYNSIHKFNYLEKRKNVIEYQRNKKYPKFYFNDINNIPTETGGVLTSNFFTIYSLDPKIKTLDSIKKNNIHKSKIILESELVKLKPENRTSYTNNFSISK